MGFEEELPDISMPAAHTVFTALLVSLLSAKNRACVHVCISVSGHRGKIPVTKNSSLSYSSKSVLNCFVL